MIGVRLAVIAFATLALCACYPVFRDVPATPKLSGRISLHGSPAAGAVVELHFQDPVLTQRDRLVTARADAQGRFSVGPMTSYRYFAAPWDQKGTDWRLDFAVGARRFQGWQNRTLDAPSEAIQVACELGDPVKAGTLGTRSAGEGMCRFVGEKE